VVKWLQLLVTGITVGSIYSLIGLGYVTIYRTSRVVNMAQGAFVMFGALFTYSFLAEVGLPYWLAGICGVAGVVIVGVVMYLLVLKRLLAISLVSVILGTIALSVLFEHFALLRWGG
jgi:branched-chain amino acid transport system permease protein